MVGNINAETYTIPLDNPFVGVEGAREEIWAYGLRNPWKFSFDFDSGNIWIADVGSQYFEEINRKNIMEGGINYGWDCHEGCQENPDSNCEGGGNFTFPIAIYNLYVNNRCAIIVGFALKDSTYPNLMGKYIFSDFCSAEIGLLDNDLNIVFMPTDLQRIYTLGEDYNGYVYVAPSSRIYKIVDDKMKISEINNLDVSINPNPSFDIFQITTEQQIDEISIHSIDGKLLQTIGV